MQQFLPVMLAATLSGKTIFTVIRIAEGLTRLSANPADMFNSNLTAQVGKNFNPVQGISTFIKRENSNDEKNADRRPPSGGNPRCNNRK